MENLVNPILDLAITIQQIPAPTFHEAERAAFVRAQFRKEGLLDVSTGPARNVYGRLAGLGDAPPIVISAHTDTVFPAGTDLSLTRTPKRIHGPGIGDNSVAVAGLIGLVWALREKNAQLPGDIWLVANTGEEGLGDLKGMREVVKRFAGAPLAYVILEGMALGRVQHRGVAVRRYRITAKTHGGHAWGQFGRPSAIHELASLIMEITRIPLPLQPRTTVNVGVIHGGISINTIAPNAHLELDLRAETLHTLEKVARQVLALVKRASRGDEIQTTAEKIGDRPAGEIPANHPLVQLAARCLQAQGLQHHISISSTDANIPLSMGLPAICIGLTTGSGAHTVSEYIDVEPLKKGLAQLVTLVEGVFQVLIK
ncbi:MAG: M20/M25/M40 family metallo-hydrolase [Anaerolineales bacterium]